MPNQEGKILPKYLNTDAASEDLKPDESPFIKGIQTGSINGNPDLGIGLNTPIQEGANDQVLTPVRSNKEIPDTILPTGYNKNIGSFESIVTQEEYYFNFNSEGNSGIYVIDGNTGICSTVLIDPELFFSDDPEVFIAEHRVRLRVIYDRDGNIIEKILLITEGKSWQKWINVNAAIKTNGFNASQFPYWSLLPPHFDRRELFEWAARPIMYNPAVVTIPNTDADINKVNRIIDQAFQISVGVNYTDGRRTCFSPYSLPLIIKSEDFLNSPDSLPKNALLTIYAGSCMVESMDIFIRYTAKQQQGIASTLAWGDWFKYDRIYKFRNSETSEGDVLSTEYWLRTGAWSNNNYDPIFNTIQYPFDNSKLAEIISQDDANMLQNSIPQLSVAQTDLGDAAALAFNRYYYDNLSSQQVNNLNVVVGEKDSTDCVVPLRDINLYAYIARSGENLVYTSQVGYINGEDTTVRFGGLQMSNGLQASITFSDSVNLKLNFGTKKAFRVYLKGTPYSADGTWAIVNKDNSITPLVDELDFSNADILTFVQNTFIAGGYFICQFKLTVPAGRYIATLGRHDDDNINTSTYIEGIANSRLKQTIPAGIFEELTTILPTAIQTYSKEIEVDCTSGNVDVWGHGQDLFYVFCPYVDTRSSGWVFVEGYLFEANDSPVPVELYPYLPVAAAPFFSGDWGRNTDKNGFYFQYYPGSVTGGVTRFEVMFDCVYPTFINVPFNSGTNTSGWFINPNAFVSLTLSVFAPKNRVLFKGKVTNLDGTLNYSNISVSIKDGSTATSKSDGTFELIIHNGQVTSRVNNIYVNSGGNFLITFANCGQIPLFVFDENLIPCGTLISNDPCTGLPVTPARYYPCLNLKINAQGGTQFSLKENGTYAIGVACADFAGRLQFVNIVKNLPVPSFLTRDAIKATFFQLLILAALKLNPDFKWFAPYVSNELTNVRYTQWVGDSAVYVDANGQVVNDPSQAVFISISITSLYNYNVSKNFSVLSSYQFTPGDRIRVLDDGNGNLLDTAKFGEPIDLQIYGTNYNQAAQAAQIIPNSSTVPIVNVSNTVNTSTTSVATTQNNTAVTIYILYDARLNSFINNTGFWIEIDTPAQTVQEIPFNEMEWKPIINGEVADFVGYDNGKPVYNSPTTITINFWDTYLYSRDINIPNVGIKFLNHPFESMSISDGFGNLVTSGGRKWVKNDNAKQLWFPADVIKSDNFLTDSFINGLGMFRTVLPNDGGSNRKDFSQYPFGGIMMMVTQRSIVFYLCENDWFTTDFQFHFSYPNAQGQMVVNLDEGLSTPHQKIGDSFGCRLEDTSSIVIWDKLISWLDAKNEGYIISDYRSAADVSNIVDETGRKYGVKSYMVKKIQFINNWNLTHDKRSRFDIVSGIDTVRRNLYITFHARRNNSNDLNSFVNQRRNIDLSHQETLVYNLDSKRWVRFDNVTPEGYGKIKGKSTGQEFITFAAGKPFYHSNTGNTSFLEFYGIQTEPCIIGVFNKFPETVKIIPTIALDILPNCFYVDLVYDNELGSFSFIPLNFFKKKENVFYAPLLRNMVSYPPIEPELLFESMLFDGKRICSRYVVIRLVGDPNNLNGYFQLSNIFYDMVQSGNNKK